MSRPGSKKIVRARPTSLSVSWSATVRAGDLQAAIRMSRGLREIARALDFAAGVAWERGEWREVQEVGP
jgi:hypothetical protein